MRNAGELRSEVERCRRLARAVGDPDLAARLLSLAEELDVKADRLDADPAGEAGQSLHGPA